MQRVATLLPAGDSGSPESRRKGDQSPSASASLSCDTRRATLLNPGSRTVRLVAAAGHLKADIAPPMQPTSDSLPAGAQLEPSQDLEQSPPTCDGSSAPAEAGQSKFHLFKSIFSFLWPWHVFWIIPAASYGSDILSGGRLPEFILAISPAAVWLFYVLIAAAGARAVTFQLRVSAVWQVVLAISFIEAAYSRVLPLLPPGSDVALAAGYAAVMADAGTLLLASVTFVLCLATIIWEAMFRE